LVLSQLAIQAEDQSGILDYVPAQQLLNWVGYIIKNFTIPKKALPHDPTDIAILSSLPSALPNNLADPATMPGNTAGHLTLMKSKKAAAASASKKKEGMCSTSRIFFLNGAASEYFFDHNVPSTSIFLREAASTKAPVKPKAKAKAKAKKPSKKEVLDVPSASELSDDEPPIPKPATSRKHRHSDTPERKKPSSSKKVPSLVLSLVYTLTLSFILLACS
jgi:hypothetical protein